MINESYRTFLLNKIIGSYLKAGLIPYAAQVEEDFQSLLVDFPDQTKPWTYYDYESCKIKEHTISSAALVNKFFFDFSQDMQVLQEECQNIDLERSRIAARNLKEIDMLNSRIRALQHQINSQLLVNQETAGYGSYLADNFSDSSLVDFNNTDALVDTDHHCVSISAGNKTYTSYDTTQITDNDIQVNILNRVGLVRTQPNLGNISDAFNTNDTAWKMQLFYSSNDRPVIVDFIVKVSNSPIPINRVAFTSYGVSPYQTKLEVFTSTDSYNWVPIPTGDPSYFFDKSVDLRFNDSLATMLKFRFTKTHYDFQQGAYFVYEFGAKQIKFSRLSYVNDSAVFQSLPLSVEDNQGNPISFNQVSLQVCETLPDDTDIKYSLSFDAGDTFIPISPLSRTGDAPTLIQLSAVNILSTPLFGLDLTTPYHYMRSNLSLLDFTVPDNVVAGSLDIWRNVGTPGHNFAIRNNLSGWGLDGQYYVCTVQVTNSAGLSINLGTTQMTINDVVRTGAVYLTPGIYTIRTNKSNWSHLQYAGVDVPYFTRATDLGGGVFQVYQNGSVIIQVEDPLYPFNHKFLIEGMPYLNPDAISGLPYQGVSLFAECKMVQVNEKVLSYDPDYDAVKYCALVDVVGIGGVEKHVIVGYSPQTANVTDRFDLEIFKVFYRLPQETDVNSCIFRASLSRGAKEVTPQLFSYIIKLAN